MSRILAGEVADAGPELRPLFTFAVIGDTHVQPEDDEPLLWPVYELANDRARYVVEAVNRAAPAFVVHLGDFIHPLPNSPAYGRTAELSRQILGCLRCPMHGIPGNHDIGDKLYPAMPGCEVSEAGLALYRQHFAAAFGSFDHAGCHLVLINAPILNSGLADEAEQRAWLKADLAAAAGRRIFLFTHYRRYLLEEREPSNYDNIDEPGRGWLLALIERHRVEAVFAGHVHNFLYHRHGRTDMYVLPATSLFRQDYAELFPIEPVAGNGRADAEKLGYALVDVLAEGHILRPVRTGGRTLAAGLTLPPEPPRVRVRHPKQRRPAPLGVHLRHPWAEITTFPYNGPMDEFVRKRVRNDHTLPALWECGIRRLRDPLADLAEPGTRARVAALKEMGHEFDVFVFGAPSVEEADLVTWYRELIAAFEVVVPPGSAAALMPALAELQARSGLPIHLSRVESSAHRPSEGSTFHHFVSFGFQLNEPDELTRILDLHGARPAIDGVVFRAALNQAPFTTVSEMAQFADAHGVYAVANICLASDSPTERVDDDQRIANRVAEAVAAAFAWPAVRVFVDTLVDQDRGNYPRHGLIDRRYNPRPASFVLRHLQAALVDLGGPFTAGTPVTDAGRRFAPMDNDRAVLWLILTEGGGAGAPPRELPATPGRGRAGTARWVDLMTGAIAAGHWRLSADGTRIELNPACPAAAQLLLVLPRAGGDAG